MGRVEDDLCNAEGGTTAAEAIAAQPEVIGVIGTTCSGAAVPVSRILSQAGMVMISGSNSSPMLTSETKGTAGSAWQPGYYRVAHNDISQGLAAAQFAFGELGAAKAAAIHDKDPYTEGLANAFVDSICDLGGMATAVRCNKCDVDDIEPILLAAAAEGPEVIFLPIFQPEGDLIIQTYRVCPVSRTWS